MTSRWSRRSPTAPAMCWSRRRGSFPPRLPRWPHPRPGRAGLDRQAGDRAGAGVATAIAAKAARGVPLATAVAEAGAPLPPVRQVAARRIELSPDGRECPRCDPHAVQPRRGQEPDRRRSAAARLLGRQGQPHRARQRTHPAGLIGRVQNEFQEAISRNMPASSSPRSARRSACGGTRAQSPRSKKRISGSWSKRCRARQKPLDEPRYVAYTFSVRSSTGANGVTADAHRQAA